MAEVENIVREGKFGIDGITQLVPNVMRGLNRVVDPYVRDVYSGTPLIAKNRESKATICYLYDPKIDLWGQPDGLR